MRWYRTGTANVTLNSTNVTGNGVDWLAGARVGEGFMGPDGRVYEISTIVSATQLTLGTPYLGATASAAAYQIVPTQSFIRDLAAQAAQLVTDFTTVAVNHVSVVGNQTIGGVKTFTSPPIVPSASFPVAALHTVPSQTLLGRVSAGNGVPEVLTAQQSADMVAGGLHASTGAIRFAIDQAGVANRAVQALHQFAQQEGVVTLRNRGVIRGCNVVRSTTSTRRLELAAGACFANGQIMDVPANALAGPVATNTSSGAVTLFAFLQLGAGNVWQLLLTAPNQPVPEAGITMYQLTIPANSTDATDPFLANVSLIDLRRIEPLFPKALQSPASLTQPITVLPDGNYHLSFDMVAAQGAPADADSLVVSSRAGNGFTVRLASAADNVVARYRLSRLNA